MATNNATPTSVASTGVFKGLKTPRELLNYNLMRGVTDFSNLEQWDLYEKGYPFLCVVSIPQFLRDLADSDDNISVIVNNYVHILENDFRGIDNIDNITGDTNGEITNGIRSIQLINKVTKASNSNFSMNYYERSGSILTKAHELYLTGIKDPDTQVKHYHGLIDNWIFNGVDTVSGKDPGPHQECFTFMYFLTDNTMTKIERAFLIAAAQPTVANFSDLYSSTKGDINFAEVQLSFNGFFINNDYVYQKAQDMLLAMRNPNNLTDSRIIVDSNNFKYSAIAKAGIESGTSGFDTPGYFSQTAGNASAHSNDMAVLPNTQNLAYTNGYQPGATTGNASNYNQTGEAKYADVVASMSGSEHAVNSTTSTVKSAVKSGLNAVASGISTAASLI